MQVDVCYVRCKKPDSNSDIYFSLEHEISLEICGITEIRSSGRWGSDAGESLSVLGVSIANQK